MSIEEALKKLEGFIEDWEMYHTTFDTLIGARLYELDPDFVNALAKHKEDNEVIFYYM